jgi:hypothetical protein
MPTTPGILWCEAAPELLQFVNFPFTFPIGSVELPRESIGKRSQFDRNLFPIFTFN